MTLLVSRGCLCSLAYEPPSLSLVCFFCHIFLYSDLPSFFKDPLDYSGLTQIDPGSSFHPRTLNIITSVKSLCHGRWHICRLPGIRIPMPLREEERSAIIHPTTGIMVKEGLPSLNRQFLRQSWVSTSSKWRSELMAHGRIRCHWNHRKHAMCTLTLTSFFSFRVSRTLQAACFTHRLRRGKMSVLPKKRAHRGEGENTE